ncbi:MAG TPA: hypothetical protein VNQ76_08460 [Planctomicrobium sp.]|nr:hypothetical protein [Planctomicrobium sp.]
MRSCLTFLILLLVLTPLIAQEEVGSKPTGVLSTLRVGQMVNVKETGEKYLITIIDGDAKLPVPHTVLEIGNDLVVVKDFTGLNETRIPLTSIKAVVHFKGRVMK